MRARDTHQDGAGAHRREGCGSTEVETLYLRAQELVDRLGKTSRRVPGSGVFGSSIIIADSTRRPGKPVEHLLDAAQSGERRRQLLEAHHALWATLSAMGHAAEAVLTWSAVSLCMIESCTPHMAFLYGGHDPGACCRYHLAVNLWLLGYPDQSLSALVDALRHAEELKHPMTRVITLWYAAWVYYQRGDRPSDEGEC